VVLVFSAFVLALPLIFSCAAVYRWMHMNRDDGAGGRASAMHSVTYPLDALDEDAAREIARNGRYLAAPPS